MLSLGRYGRISTKNSKIITWMDITLPPPPLQYSHGENAPQLSSLRASADRA